MLVKISEANESKIPDQHKKKSESGFINPITLF